jgi:hypothetical protein
LYLTRLPRSKEFPFTLRHIPWTLLIANNLCIIFGTILNELEWANFVVCSYDFIIQLHNALMLADWFRDYSTSS